MNEIGKPPMWAPVVYGRTKHADFWWRAVPTGMDHRGWLSDVIHAVVDGGKLLDRPRFLLARSEDDSILFGVACRTAELSADMNMHERRGLYCFVGWAAFAITVGEQGRVPRAPALTDIERQWAEWAKPTYRDWVGRDWEEHESRLRQPRPSEPEPVPWDREADEQTWRSAEPKLNPLMVRPGWVWLLPGADADRYWQRGLVTSRPYVLVVGWADACQARREGATHICVDGATAHLEELAVPPEPASARITAQPRPAEKKEPDDRPEESEGRGVLKVVTAVADAVGSTVEVVWHSAANLVKEVTGEGHDEDDDKSRAPDPDRRQTGQSRSGPVTGRKDQVDAKGADYDKFFE